MTDESVVVDNGQTYVSTETAEVATDAANRAKLWAEESERQANLSSGSAVAAAEARDDAVNAVNGFTQRVTEATNTFNSNATAKTNDFNTNATNKTTAFNNNASSKTTDFNNNATAKTTAFNNNYTEKKTLIDAQVEIAESSATNANNYKNKAREWAISQNVVDNEDYSSKYWAGKAKEWAESVSSPVNKNLSNLNPQGQNIANWSTNVTNCITEIPQDIKLELNNGTLTLKAGSKVYVPNGSSVFDEKTISSDISIANLTYNTTYLLFTDTNATFLFAEYSSSCSSGTTQPSGTWKTWYDTTNNKIKRFGNTEGTVLYEGSLPIAIITVSGGAISSIDQVFNGFGYIGSTVFALPGVKGLVPNGRNADGSLKNIEFINSIVRTRTFNFPLKRLCIRQDGFMGNPSDGGVDLVYDEVNNQIKQGDYYWLEVAQVTASSTSPYAITSLTPKTAFHALEYNDSPTISGWAMPSSRYIDLNLGASGATYTAPANGYFMSNFSSSGTNGFIAMYARNSACATANSGRYGIGASIPVAKGENMRFFYENGSVDLFRFYYAEGEN